MSDVGEPAHRIGVANLDAVEQTRTWLALGLDWGIAGIGWSSFIAEFAKLAATGALIWYLAGHDLRAALADRAEKLAEEVEEKATA